MKPEDLGCTPYTTTQYKKRMNLDIIKLEELEREKKRKKENQRNEMNAFFSFSPPLYVFCIFFLSIFLSFFCLFVV